jgi:hypothetical protein
MPLSTKNVKYICHGFVNSVTPHVELHNSQMHIFFNISFELVSSSLFHFFFFMVVCDYN